MADHAVHGVDGLVDEQAGRPEQDIKENGGDDPVAEVFGRRFDGGAGDAVLVELLRVAPDDVRHGLAAGLQIVLKPPPHGAHMIIQPALRDQQHDAEHFDDPAPGVDERQPGHAQPQAAGQRHHGQHGDGAAHGAVHFRAFVAVQLAVEPVDDRTE